MIHFEGEERFTLPLERVRAALSDGTFLVEAQTNVHSVMESTPDRASWKLKPNFSFLSGTLDTTLQVVERTEGATHFEIASKSIGATSKVIAHLTFLPDEEGTRVRWTADILELKGLLKLVPRPLIQATAQKVIADVWADIGVKFRGEAESQSLKRI